MSATRKLRRAAQKNAALTAARVSGCVCKPDVRHVHSDDGFPRVEILHDSWCPMIDGGRQHILYIEPRCER
jgi:hypothetical protein